MIDNDITKNSFAYKDDIWLNKTPVIRTHEEENIDSVLTDIDIINRKIEQRLDVILKNKNSSYTLYIAQNLRDDLKKTLKNLKLGR